MNSRFDEVSESPKRESFFRSVSQRIRLAVRLSHEKRSNETDLQEIIRSKESDTRKKVISRLLSHSDQDVISPQNGVIAVGEICFWKNYAYEQEGRPFIKATHTVYPKNVANTMHKLWKMEPPKIVALMISNVDQLREWNSQRQIIAFQNGLIKAANTTNMWIFTNGANIGASKLIGDAVQKELKKRQSYYYHNSLHGSSEIGSYYDHSYPKLNLIGVISNDMIKYSELLIDKEKVKIENQGNLIEDGKFELNYDHTHFISIQDNTINKIGINMFILKFMSFLSTIGGPDFNRDCVDNLQKDVTDLCSLTLMDIPVVALVIQGGSDCARLVVDCLKKKFPVVVMRGSGGLADLLAYAYLELEQRSNTAQWGNWDPDYIECFLKPELANKIINYFPRLTNNIIARNNFRDRILESVRLAKQDNLSFLTILNMHNYSECNLENLSVYLLRALFKSKPRSLKDGIGMSDDKILNELYLTLDWNCPDVAKTEVLVRDSTYVTRLHKELFAAALLKKNREEFVDLFLKSGFRVHKFVTPSRLRNLFRYIYKDEFFHTVCWEGVLGHSILTKPSKHFIDTNLNWLIEACTGLSGFVNSDHLYYNVMSMYIHDAASAERKALTILTLWALFANRLKLAKTFWKNSDQPIHLGLIASMVSDRLSWYVTEANIKMELKEQSKQFTEMAIGVLDECYKETAPRAFDVLSEENSTWNYKTAVDIAANARTKAFLAHPCCQKWLTNTFLGKIRIRELSWGCMTIPASIKILMCAFLIFPMYVWVRFKPNQRKESEKIEEEEEEKEGGEESVLTVPKISGDQPFRIPKDSNGADYATLIKDRELFVRYHPPLWKMICLMWTAPITKFYTFHIFYIIYLILFSYAVLYPSCGHQQLDFAICLWTSLIVIEYLRRTYILYKKYTSIPLVFKCIEILLIIAFIITYATYTAGFGLGFFSLSPYGRKVILCFALLYFYYRLIAIYLPISPTLGPLLYRLRLMVIVDFVNFMKMALVIIISGGIVLQALLYPDLPVSSAVIHQAFNRAWFSLFITPIADFESDIRCRNFYVRSLPDGVCYAGKYNNTASPVLCPDNGIWPYLFAIQYFVLLKLILLTLLYALFSATASKLQTETDAIWKYQRYILVVDFSHRLPLPSPLSAFCYLYFFFKWILDCVFCYYPKGQCKKSKTKTKVDGILFMNVNDKYREKLSEQDYAFWRQLARKYSDRQEELIREKDIAKQQWDRIQSIAEEIEYEKKTLRKIRGKMMKFERMINVSQVYLENIIHVASMKFGGLEKTLKSHHILSRKSPYPGTNISRTPIADKYVPWEVMWIDYDPVVYTKPKVDFPMDMIEFVDEDILMLREMNDTNFPVLRWNISTTNAAGITIDRSSWIFEEHQPLIYKLYNGIPMNPKGRTGLRGKGSLPRWGPNHYSALVITRLSKVEGRVIEILIEKNLSEKGKFCLPIRFIPGDDLYSSLSSLFKLMPETSWTTKDDVISFFNEYCEDVKFDIQSPDYMDDSLNTDNAWKEINLIHVHYACPDNLFSKIKPINLAWRVITEEIFVKLPAGQSAILQGIVDKLQGFRIAVRLSHEKRSNETDLQEIIRSKESDTRKKVISRLLSHSDQDVISPQNGVIAVGEICFWKNYAYEQEGRPFIKATHTVYPKNVANTMHKLWKMEPPKIVALMISNVDQLREWNSQRQIIAFQNGLIKAANTTNMWIFTNGANIGASKLIGDAVQKELKKRQSYYYHNSLHGSSEIGSYYDHSYPKLNLIGVISNDMIKYSELLIDKEKVKIENQGNLIEDLFL